MKYVFYEVLLKSVRKHLNLEIVFFLKDKLLNVSNMFLTHDVLEVGTIKG